MDKSAGYHLTETALLIHGCVLSHKFVNINPLHAAVVVPHASEDFIPQRIKTAKT